MVEVVEHLRRRDRKVYGAVPVVLPSMNAGCMAVLGVVKQSQERT